MKKKYVVHTHLGDMQTEAATPARAKSNIQFKIFRKSPAAKRYTRTWTVSEAASETST